MIINDNRSEITADGKYVQFNLQVPSGGVFGSDCYFSRGVWVYNQDTIDLTNIANNYGGDYGIPINKNYVYDPDRLFDGMYINPDDNPSLFKSVNTIIPVSGMYTNNPSATVTVDSVKGTDLLFVVTAIKGMPDDILCKYNDGLQIVPVYQKSLLSKWLSNSSRMLLNGDPADYTNHVHNIMLATAIDNAAKAGKFNLMIEYWNEFIGKRMLYDECTYSEAETFKPCNCK